MLRISDGVGELGTVQWDIALALFLSWLLLYFCLWKGIKWTGKVCCTHTPHTHAQSSSSCDRRCLLHAHPAHTRTIMSVL